jgi:hypothetical protein
VSMIHTTVIAYMALALLYVPTLTFFTVRLATFGFYCGRQSYQQLQERGKSDGE